jgi:hypothetical protein
MKQGLLNENANMNIHKDNVDDSNDGNNYFI